MPNSYSSNRKLGQARAREYALVSSFKLGYRNREDITNLPPGVLIVGSQNVLTNVSDRVQIRQGYSVDGATSSVAAPILASFDWKTRGNDEKHLRAGSLTSAGNDGKLQYRYVDSLGAVTWRDLTTGLSSVAYNFDTYWNTVEELREVLFVNGSSNIFRWNGATATIASRDNTAGHIASVASAPTAGGSGYVVGDVLTLASGTAGTVTVVSVTAGVITAVALTSIGSGYTTGTKITSGGTGSGATINVMSVATGQIAIAGATSALDAGFYSSTGLSIVINGTTYTYTSLFGNSFLGISPSAAGEAVGSIIHQAVVTTPNSTMSGITATFKNGLIAVMNNQVFIGSLTSSVMWLSKVNSYTDYTGSTPRQAGEGGSLILDQNLVAFIVQGAQDAPSMYVSAGTDIWYKITFTDYVSVAGSSGQTLGAVPIKSGKRQGAISQAFVSSMKNNTISVSNEPTIDSMGVTENYLTQIQTTNLSDPIKLDVDGYNFIDGSIFYFRYNIYVAIPKEGIVRVYSLATDSWEAPQTLPISRFYIVDGELYGHSYNTFESYKLFTGYADRVYPGFTGFPIAAVWTFSYQNFGTRSALKSATALYVEGYINTNTEFTAQITYELNGCATIKTFTLEGSNTQFVCIPSPEGSLGKESLGKEKLGGAGTSSLTNLPPKFRWIPTFNNTDFFESSISFSVLGTDNRAEILAFGLNASSSTQERVTIKD